ncbi:MAG: hypothetical protein N3G20_08795, partial [Verrucomicrobiae bacterium]|nr:hypothetical protein [Verrucomicrobiae bacterium]
MSVVAQSSHDLPLGPSTGSDGFKLPPFFHDIPVLIGVALALLLVFLIWAVFLRPRSRRRA